ncbi:Nucleoporin GLE1 [Eumeta japonica]|uniref:mRNA export factor GLE1 n=1 Tax=Eumeta variegata TaxID=151549 RepID=A0A4C1WA36_EUMVA|nr:Nucleoporin GLE1 [Eumeta japonica]
MANIINVRSKSCNEINLYNNNEKKRKDDYVCSELVDFQRLRISALTKAAEISPFVKEITIGPNSPSKIEDYNKEKENPISTEDLIEDKIGNDLKDTIIIKEYEAQLHENSEVYFKNLIEKMIIKRTEIMRKYWNKQTENCERKALELRSRKLQMLKELQDSDNLSVLEKAKLDEQNNQLINRKTIENMNKILEEQNIATARFASITDSHTKFCIIYNEINQMLLNSHLPADISGRYIMELNSNILDINTLMDSCKSGSITETEVKQAEILALNIEKVKRNISNDIVIMKKREQEIEEEENHKKEEALKLSQEKVKKEQQCQPSDELTSADKSIKTKPVFYSNKNYTNYEELYNFLCNYESQYKDLLTDSSWKKFRFDCQKAVNTPVNAISSVNSMHMRDKYEKLSKLLRGERVQILDTYVTVSQHPQGLAYCTALLARKIVRQGDLLVSSNAESAFPLAAITVALLPQFPDFAKLLEANFYRECPYLVPMFLPQVEGQSDKDFYRSRGYHYNEEGVVEKQDKFLKRMSGIFRLRCAIWTAKCPKFVNANNPQGLQCAWHWIASFLNLKIEPDICATLIYDFFNVCGFECHKRYGKQFMKIIRLIHKDYLMLLDKIDEGGPKTRLEVYLQKIIETGEIPPPSGLLPSHIW